MDTVKINLQNYMNEMTTLSVFHSYAESALTDPNAFKDISETYATDFEMTLRPYIKDGVTVDNDHKKSVHDAAKAQLATTLSHGLPTFRRLVLVAAHSIFELYLCHVLRAFLYGFPQILKDEKFVERNVTYRKIIDLRSDGVGGIFDEIINDEIERFSHAGLGKIIKFMKRNLYIEHTGGIQDGSCWIWNGKEQWVEVDETRHKIIHDEIKPDVSKDYVTGALGYLSRTMFVVGIIAQANKGVTIIHPLLADYIRQAVPMNLKG